MVEYIQSTISEVYTLKLDRVETLIEPPKDFDYGSIKTTKIPLLVSNVTLWNSFKVNGEYVDNVLYSVDLTKRRL